MDMSATPDTAAQIAELKNAPKRVKRVAGFGTLLGVLVFFSFCASAFAGHVGWGRALASGAVQFLLLWFVSFSVHARHRRAWWGLLVLLALRMWGGLGHCVRIVRVTMEGRLAEHGREIAFDAAGVAQFVIAGVLVWLLFSRDVRNYVHKTLA
jgi:hypothetical protein